MARSNNIRYRIKDFEDAAKSLDSKNDFIIDFSEFKLHRGFVLNARGFINNLPHEFYWDHEGKAYWGYLHISHYDLNLTSQKIE